MVKLVTKAKFPVLNINVHCAKRANSVEISLPHCFSTTANFRSLLVGTGSNSISLFFSTCVSPPLHRQPHHPHLQNHHSLQLVFWEYLKASHRNLLLPPQTIKTQDYKQENSASLRPYKAWLCMVCLSLPDEAFLQWGLGKIFLYMAFSGVSEVAGFYCSLCSGQAWTEHSWIYSSGDIGT